MSEFGVATVIANNTPPVLVAAVGDVVHPLPDLLGDDAPRTFDDALANWDRFVDAVAAALDTPAATRAAIPMSTVEFRPPGTARPTVWCAGANYTDHAKEMGASTIEKRAYHFLSPPTALNGHRRPVHRPAGATELDWEVELTAVVGRPASRVRAKDALSYVAGYTVANDVSVRDRDRVRHPVFGMDWTVAKNSDGLTPLGPAIVPARFVGDPGDLDLSLTVNGQIRQQSNTSRMIVDLAEQIAILSTMVTLQPGDLILTGTPAGTAAGHNGAYLADGDVMVAAISRIGSLQNTVV